MKPPICDACGMLIHDGFVAVRVEMRSATAWPAAERLAARVLIADAANRKLYHVADVLTNLEASDVEQNPIGRADVSFCAACIGNPAAGHDTRLIDMVRSAVEGKETWKQANGEADVPSGQA